MVEVTNFICDNPWPNLPVFEDRANNCNGLNCLDTNFQLYYCQDAGKPGTSDDLPSLADPDTVKTILAGDAGANLLKHFILPVCKSRADTGQKEQDECIASDSGNISTDAIGIRVMRNPLHLSPATWYTTGLCGGVPAFEAMCTKDSDCLGVSDSTLVAYWGFNEGSGTTAVDSSSNRNNGTITGATWERDGKIDKALNFSADPSYVKRLVTPSLDSIDSDLTVSLWVKPTAISGLQHLIDKGCHFELDLDGSGRINFNAIKQGAGCLNNPLFGITADGSGDALTNNNWYHVVGVYDRSADSGTMKIYINGKKVKEDSAKQGVCLPDNFTPVSVNTPTFCTANYAATCPAGKVCCPADKKNCSYALQTGINSSLAIGMHSGFAANQFKGFLDEVRIYNRALTDYEVQGLYNLRAGNKCEMNVTKQGAVQGVELGIDGYEAVADDDATYIGATNLYSGHLYSNIYQITYAKEAETQKVGAKTVEIFKRILDPGQQWGVIYFNPSPEFSNQRTCQDVGYFQGTRLTCDWSAGTQDIYNANACAAHDNASCGTDRKHLCFWSTDETPNTCLSKTCSDFTDDGKTACIEHADAGCYWQDDINGCMTKPCNPIYCTNDFQCPNLTCNAEKEKVVRDNSRFGNLRDNQVVLRNQKGRNRGYPVISSGSYVPNTTFSIWPSWQAKLGQVDLGATLFTDPINLFYQCPGGYRCDKNNNGKIDTNEDDASNSCDYIYDSAKCPDHICIPKDSDLGKTCWDEKAKLFNCPVDAANPLDIKLFSYAYKSVDNGQDYQLLSNFEYGGEGNWRTRPVAGATSGAEESKLYQLPMTFVNQECRPFNFEIHQATVGGGVAAVDCSSNGGDADLDGVCDGNGSGLVAGYDNCPGRLCAN